MAKENSTEVAMLMKTIDEMVKQNDGQIFNFQDAWGLSHYQAKIQQLEALMTEKSCDMEDQELKHAEWLANWERHNMEEYKRGPGPRLNEEESVQNDVMKELKEEHYVPNKGKVHLSKDLKTEITRQPYQPTFDSAHSEWNLSADFVQQIPGYEIIPEAPKDKSWAMMVKIEVSLQSAKTLAQVTLLSAMMKQHGCIESLWEMKWVLVQGLILLKLEEAYGQSEGDIKVGVQAVEFQPEGAPEDNRDGCCIQETASQPAIKEANGQYPDRENGDSSAQDDIEQPGRREGPIKFKRRNSMEQDYNFKYSAKSENVTTCTNLVQIEVHVWNQ